MLPSILVIDDEIDNFDVIETLLYKEGYQLHYAPSAEKAIGQLAIFQPDVILLDVMMPDMDGIEACRRIKADQEWQAVPIIMVTALTAKEDLAKCLDAGADDFISKPVNGLELRARVNSMLRIKQQHDSLEELLKLREDMVKMIVHDLRNPLGTIFLAIDMIRLLKLSPEKIKKTIEEIALNAAHLQSLIDSMLLMAKLESGKMAIDPTEIDLEDICKSTVADFQAIAGEKQLEIISDLPEPGGRVKLDPAIFRRVLDNLLSNAIKFSPSNSQIFLGASYLETGGAKIQVRDSGPGVSEELREKIFQQYEIGNIIKGVKQTGLGLAFCKMAIEAHGGQITVADNQPQGAIFTILL
ncbi:MAG: response regulator [Hormoscilla sp.]